MPLKVSKPCNLHYPWLVIACLVVLALGAAPLWAARADSITECASGCDFTAIRAAIDSLDVAAGSDFIRRRAGDWPGSASYIGR